MIENPPRERVGEQRLREIHEQFAKQPAITCREVCYVIDELLSLRSLLAASREALEAGAAALNIEAMSVRNSLPSSHAASDALNEHAAALHSLAHQSGEAS